jgi:hypothetical protein
MIMMNMQRSDDGDDVPALNIGVVMMISALLLVPSPDPFRR